MRFRVKKHGTRRFCVILLLRSRPFCEVVVAGGRLFLSCHIGRADREYACKYKVVGSNFIGDIFGTQTEKKRRHGGKSTWATSRKSIVGPKLRQKKKEKNKRNFNIGHPPLYLSISFFLLRCRDIISSPLSGTQSSFFKPHRRVSI